MPVLPPIGAQRVNPVSDGSLLYSCLPCNNVRDGRTVDVTLDVEGTFKFSAAAAGPGVSRAWLAVNRYAAVSGPTDLVVWAYGEGSASLSPRDLDRRRQLLGFWHIPADVEAGEDIYFEVTDFVRSATTPYIAFGLRWAYTDEQFSSLEVNLGHPAQLILATVPEPGPGALLAAGLLTMGGWLRRRARR